MIKNKHDVYRGKDSMKKFCESLREHIIEIINFEKKNAKPLIENERESYATQKYCHICIKT